MEYLLLQAVAVPLIVAPVVLLLGKRLGRHVGWIAFASLAYTTVLLASLAVSLFNGGGSVSESYTWAPVSGLVFGLLGDNLSVPVALTMNIVVTATSVYSMGYMKHRIEVMYGEERKGQYGIYFLNFMLLDAGLIGISLATNLLEMYMFLELMLIPSAFMMALFGYENKERVAIMYFIWNHIGAFIFLAGIVVAYTATGSFQVSALSTIPLGTVAYWAVGLILVGWLIKMAIFGVHMWLPYAHAEHPTSFAPIMATIVAVGNYVVVRLLVQNMPAAFLPFSFPLMVMALITMVFGGAMTMVQNDVKYVYAWSTISQNAYSLLGIGSLTVLGVSGGIFYFLNHIIGKTILFCVAGIIVSQVGTRDIRKMGGLASKMPLTASLVLIGTMIISAVPPTGGFQAEWLLFEGVFTRGTAGVLGWNLVVALGGLAATIFTVAYTFWPVRRIFFGALPAELKDVREAPLIMTAPILVLAALSIVIGIYPDLFFRSLYHFASSIGLGGR